MLARTETLKIDILTFFFTKNEVPLTVNTLRGTHWRFHREIVLFVIEYVTRVESRTIQSIVAFERNAKKFPITLNVEFFQLTTVTRMFAVPAHVVRELNKVTRRHSLAPVKSNKKK